MPEPTSTNFQVGHHYSFEAGGSLRMFAKPQLTQKEVDKGPPSNEYLDVATKEFWTILEIGPTHLFTDKWNWFKVECKGQAFWVALPQVEYIRGLIECDNQGNSLGNPQGPVVPQHILDYEAEILAQIEENNKVKRNTLGKP